MAKTSRSQEVPVANTVTVVSGSIRSRDDDNALAVKLSIWDTEITMRANGSELGNWPVTAVAIKPIDARSFEFIAEGDHLIFSPDDPEEFGRHPVVSSTILGGGRKRSRRSMKKKDAPARSELAWDQESAEETRRRSQRPKRDQAPKQKKQSRRERKAAAANADAAEVESIEVFSQEAAPEPDSPPVLVPTQTEVIPRELALADPTREKKRRPRRERPNTNGIAEVNDADGLGTKRHRAWIFALDQARKYDLFGLDRVPINEALRGQGHEHTWDHRVAPESGPGSRVCTLCGQIRRSS